MLEILSIDSSVASCHCPHRRAICSSQSKLVEGLERANSHGNDGERNQISAAKTAAAVNQGDLSWSRKNDYSPELLIHLPGCCNSVNDRWGAAMHARTILPEDSSERPVLFSRKSALRHAMLPHMLMQPGINASSGSQKNFLSELQNAIHSFRGNSDANDLRSSRIAGEINTFT